MLRRDLAAATTPELQTKFTARLVLAEQQLCELTGGPPPLVAPAVEIRRTPRKFLLGEINAAVGKFHAARSRKDRHAIGRALVGLESRHTLSSNSPAPASGDRGKLPSNIVTPAAL